MESKYNEYLQGKAGKILTLTDSRGLTVDNAQERIAPEDGKTLVTSIDVVVQQYAEQTLAKAVEAKGAKMVLLL